MRNVVRKNLRYLRLLACVPVAFCFSACMEDTHPADTLERASASMLAPPPLQTTGSSSSDLLRVNTILIAPTQFEKDIQPSAAEQERFDRALELAAEQELTVEFTPPAKARPLFPTSPVTNDQFTKRAIDVARKANRQGVLVVRVSTVAESDGSALGADSPAALGFTSTLYQVSDERAAWSAHYFIQDQAILDNLLNVRNQLSADQGPGWKSLEEHLTRGFSEALRDLSTKRQEAFSNPSP